MTESRYIRQLGIIGKDGQDKLAKARVLCVGAGGLGSLANSFLVTAGVKEIGIIDNDKIEISNLTRQLSYTEDDCGKTKVQVLKDYLQKRNSNCQINAYYCHLQDNNVEQIIKDYDVILDCTDNFASKYLISDTCNLYNKPLISASIDGFNGQVLTLLQDICYRCIFQKAKNNDSCMNGDVIGSAVGIVASTQANEAFKLISGLNNTNQLIQIDCMNNITRRFELSHDPACINNHEDMQLTTFESKTAHLPWDKALELYKKNEASIVDIRLNKDVALGIHTINFSYENITKLNLRKDKSIVVVCNYGQKSKLAALKLAAIGYQQIFHTDLAFIQESTN